MDFIGAAPSYKVWTIAETRLSMFSVLDYGLINSVRINVFFKEIPDESAITRARSSILFSA